MTDKARPQQGFLSLYPLAFFITAIAKIMLQADSFSATLALLLGGALFLHIRQYQKTVVAKVEHFKLAGIKFLFLLLLFLLPRNTFTSFSWAHFPVGVSLYWLMALAAVHLLLIKKNTRLAMIFSVLAAAAAIIQIAIIFPLRLYPYAFIPLFLIILANVLFYKKGIFDESNYAPYIVVSSLALIGIYVVIIKCAWVAEDAFITFRTIDNFIHGYGLRWNIGERVQTYTHPLWMLLIMAARLIGGDFFYTAIMVGVLGTFGALFFLNKTSASNLTFLGALILLSSSKAFVDYATSGLENPLSYFLVAWFLGLFLANGRSSKKLFLMSLAAGLATLNRMDTLLLYLPSLALLFWLYSREIKVAKVLGLMAAGFSPFILWEIFSLFYYGFLFPNTAYAKLNTGYPALVLIQQGLQFFLNAWHMDPIVLITIIFSIITAVFSKQLKFIAIALGILFYAVYLLKIGGDYMSGRFLTVPFFISVVVLAHSWSLKLTQITALLAGLMILSLVLPYNPWKSDASYVNTSFTPNLIVDERGGTYAITGLLTAEPEHRFNNGRQHFLLDVVKSFERQKSSLITHGAMGLLGFLSGPKVHIVDYLALCDPLLARLPASVGKARIGHFRRIIPAGYLDTLRTGEDKFTDRKLGKYYSILSAIIKGPLFSLQRFKYIINMNLGKYNHLINREFYKYQNSNASKRSFLQADSTDDYARLVDKGIRAAMHNQWEEARNLWEQAISLNAKRPEAVANLGLFFEKNKQYLEAMQCYQFVFQVLGAPWDRFYQEVQQKQHSQSQP